MTWQAIFACPKLKELDTNENGRVEWEEFQAHFATEFKGGRRSNALRAAFDKLDKDGTDSFDASEVNKVGRCRLIVSKPVLTAPVVSALETRIPEYAFNVCFQCQLAPLQQGRRGADGRQGRHLRGRVRQKCLGW
jgi:hypothetical protein